MRSMTIDAGGPVHVADFGGSGPVMLLVHGLGGSHLNWLSVAAGLARHHRVYALDLPGFGSTPLAGRGATIGDNVQLVGDVAARLGAGPVTLAGNSMGGLISIGVAATNPELIRALILVDPAVPPSGSGRVRLDAISRSFLAAALLPQWGARRLSRFAEAMGPEAIVRDTLQLCCVDPSRIDASVIDAHVALETARMAQPMWHESFYAATRSLMHALVLRSRLMLWVRSVVAPTLLIHGERDRLVRLRAAEAIAALRPDWEFHVIGGVGHVPMLEAPGEFLDVTGSWLGSDGRDTRTPAASALAG